MADLFDGYPLGEVWDEMFGEPGRARPAYAGLFASMQPIDGEELAARADLLSQTYRDAGVTFAHAAEEQPLPLDIDAALQGGDRAGGDGLRVPRLLGLHGHGLRPAQPARGAGGDRDVDRGGRPRPRRARPRRVERAGRPRGARAVR